LTASVEQVSMTAWLLIASLLVTPVALRAQEPALEDLTNRVIKTTVRVVVAPTTVLDKDGNYVAGLKPSEFTLYDNGKKQDIRVEESFAPISLVVAIQADAKVESVIPKLQKIGLLLQNFVAGQNGEVAILAFDHRIQKLQDFTDNPELLVEALKKLKAGSSQSVLVDAVAEGARMLRTRPRERRRVILLISESLDKGSGGRLREALTQVEINNVQVYAVNISRLFTELTSKAPRPRPDPIPPAARPLPPGAPATPTSVAQISGLGGMSANFVPLLTEIFRGVKAIFVPNPVEVFTRYTGGKEFPFLTQRDLERAIAEIGTEIHNQYLISYTPNNMEEGGYHEIKVEVARRGLEVRTRPGYWLAAIPSN
jgi:VWFA-related protein